MSDYVLSPETPLVWIMARLRARQELLDLLGDGPFPQAGKTFLYPPIYQKGELPAKLPARFVVVIPPEEHSQGHSAETLPRDQTSRFLVYAETSSDKLPPGLDLDGALVPMRDQIVLALRGVQTSAAGTGNVWSSVARAMWTPKAITLSETVKIKQKGVWLELLST